MRNRAITTLTNCVSQLCDALDDIIEGASVGEPCSICVQLCGCSTPVRCETVIIA